MDNIRQEFPIFSESGQLPLAYLDSAASAQKPRVVIEAMNDFLSKEYSNIHRGAYKLSSQATTNYENTRAKVASFLNAVSEKEIVFTRGTTESINLVAYSFGEILSTGDAILLTELEHHSNIVPWQILAERKGLKLGFVPINSNTELKMDVFEKKLTELQPKLVAVTQQSNAYGTIVPVKQIIEAAHKQGAKVLVDAAQSVVHQQIDVQALDVDFLAFSGHKLYGPTGVGVLYAKAALLDAMPPFLGGGDMIESVDLSGSIWAQAPAKFEAGTPPIAEVIGLNAAIDFVGQIGFSEIAKRDAELTKQAYAILSAFSEVELYGAGGDMQSGIVSFNIKNAHPHDFSTIADSFNVQLRAGFHCAMPALRALGLTATARISFGIYNQEQDLLQLEDAVKKAIRLFA